MRDGDTEREIGELLRRRLREEAPAIVEEALEDGRRRLRAWLSDLVVAAGAETAAELLGSAGAPRSPDGDGWYVYGVAAPSALTHLGPLPGIAGRPTEVVAGGSLAAVISPVEVGTDIGDLGSPATDPQGLTAAVRAHERVLERMLALGAVVPLRFGTVASSQSAASDLLERRGAEFTAALQRVSGAAEWGLTVSWDDDVAARQLPAAPGPSVDASAGAAYLRARQLRRAAHDELDRLGVEVGTALHGEVSRLARASVRQAGAGGSRGRGSRVILRASYLIDKQSEQAFTAVLEERLAADATTWGWAGELSGPWPPYHFADPEAVPG